jgi:hypothetical protein
VRLERGAFVWALADLMTPEQIEIPEPPTTTVMIVNVVVDTDYGPLNYDFDD